MVPIHLMYSSPIAFVQNFNATVSAGDCYGPCVGGGSDCVFGNSSVPCLASAGASPQVLARIIGASRNLTAFRIKIAPANAVNVFWAEHSERVAVSYFPGRDYNGAQITADAARVPAPWKASSLLPSVNWTFTIDPLDQGLGQNWSQPNSSAGWNSTAIISSKGWCCGRVPAVTDRHEKHSHTYTGVGWYRVEFNGGGAADATTEWAAAFTAVNGSSRVWLNGVAAVSQTNTLWRFADAPLPTANTLIVRLDAQHKAGGGLTGRVFIARDDTSAALTRLKSDDEEDCEAGGDTRLGIAAEFGSGERKLVNASALRSTGGEVGLKTAFRGIFYEVSVLSIYLLNQCSHYSCSSI